MTQPPTIGYYWSSGGLGSSSDPCCLYNAIRTRAVHRTHTGRMLHGPNLIRPALIPIVMTLFPTSDVFKYLPSNGWFPICRNYKYVSPLNVLTFLGSYIYSTNLSICLLHPDHPSSLSSIQCLPYQPTQSIYPAHNLLY